jgi:3-phytase
LSPPPSLLTDRRNWRTAALALTVVTAGALGARASGWTGDGHVDPDESKRPVEATMSVSQRGRSSSFAFLTASRETAPVPNSGDAADDPAIWVNRRRPARSAIIGTDKRGGLAVYNLAGRQIQYRPDGKINNVDLRTGFRLGGREVALVTAGNKSDNSLAIYRIDVSTRRLVNVAARRIRPGVETQGSCMYHSPVSGKFYYFVTSESGQAEQWELFDKGSGKVDARKVRSLTIGDETEGCVADDRLARFYVSEEPRGIWRYDAEPSAGTRRALVDSTGRGGHLVADVEGLAIAHGRGRRGYLIASSQGNNSFVVYERAAPNDWVTSFKLRAGNRADGVEDTDGIDVTTANLGPVFSTGLFVAQDGKNDNGNQNFKLVRWRVPARARP